jgi:hypothetical protein
MPGLAGCVVLTVGERSYTWEDVVLAGHLWGEWEALERRVRVGLACLARLDDLDEDDDNALDEHDVETTAAEFRYARGLESAEQMEAWLGERDVTVEAWLDGIRRSLLLRQWESDLDGIEEEYELDPDEVAEAIRSETICTGHAAGLASRLATRAAVYARVVGERGDDGDGVMDEELRAALAPVPRAIVDEGLPGLSPEQCRERLEALARLEVVWQRFAAAEASDAAVQDLVASRWLDWIRLHAVTVSGEDRDTISEVALCVREDRRNLADVGAEAGVAVDEIDWYVGEIDGSLRDLLIGAKAGDLLGPLPLGEGFLLVSVVSKHPPSATDPGVRARAEQALLARTVDREVQTRVTWLRAL